MRIFFQFLEGLQNCLYAIISHQEQENSPDIVTGMRKVLTFKVYALLDPRKSLSFVTPYIKTNVVILIETFQWFYTFGESILVDRVYHGCAIFVNSKETMTNLVELDIVDFDVTLGMDQLYACYASVEC